MNEKILISYIIPAYNAADTLERAVESITHTCNMEKCEILIVENGSTDYTNSVALKLIQKYGENVKLIHSEKGVSRARNEGLKNARGEWIVFVDADDYIVSKSKKYIYEDILNAKADLYVYSYEIGNRANYINNKEEKTYYFNDSAEKMKLEMIANPTKFMQVWGKIFRKSIIYENRIGFNTKMQLSEDSDFTLHYLMHCSRISISDTIFYHYSIDNESTMRSNADKKVLQYIEAIVSFCWCIGVILYKGLDQYHVLGDPLYYLLWFYLGYRLENMIEWLKKHNIWKDSSILCLFGLVCLSFIVDKIVKIHFFHFLSSYIVCPFFMLIVLNYIVRHIKINGRAIKSLSDYGMGIYLYAEPLNYLFLFWFYRFCGIEFFGSEFGAAIIYFSRIVITPIIAIGITWILKKFNLKYLY